MRHTCIETQSLSMEESTLIRKFNITHVIRQPDKEVITLIKASPSTFSGPFWLIWMLNTILCPIPADDTEKVTMSYFWWCIFIARIIHNLTVHSACIRTVNSALGRDLRQLFRELLIMSVIHYVPNSRISFFEWHFFGTTAHARKVW